MPRATFLLSKDPVTERAGDVELGRLMMRLAADAYDVSAICLSTEVDSVELPGGIPVNRIPKPMFENRQCRLRAGRRKPGDFPEFGRAQRDRGGLRCHAVILQLSNRASPANRRPPAHAVNTGKNRYHARQRTS